MSAPECRRPSSAPRLCFRRQGPCPRVMPAGGHARVRRHTGRGRLLAAREEKCEEAGEGSLWGVWRRLFRPPGGGCTLLRHVFFGGAGRKTRIYRVQYFISSRSTCIRLVSRAARGGDRKTKTVTTENALREPRSARTPTRRSSGHIAKLIN